jgi:leukotriene-A4 hydrolase
VIAALLAGDRSLVDVVVHELTHSWFGNGVTYVFLSPENTFTDHFKISSHAHASHFWLNEGWTTYMERVLQQILRGPAERGFAYVIGNKALRDDLERYVERPKYQRLVIDFEPGEDPDEAYSSVPYEKGANFLLHLGMSPLFITFARRTDGWVKSELLEAWMCSSHTSATTSKPSAERASLPNNGRTTYTHTSGNMVAEKRSRFWTRSDGM